MMRPKAVVTTSVMVMVLATAATAHAATVTMRRESGSWVVRAPDGTVINTGGSTCEGLPEAITYARDNGHSLHVQGGQITSAGTDPGVINCTQTLWLPPMQKAHVRLDAVTLNFPATIGDNRGLVFDSAMMLSWEHRGQVVYQGTGRAVTFFPRTLLPLDPVIGIIDSRIEILTVAVSASATHAVTLEAGNGGIQRTSFEFQEINGGQVGIMVWTPISDALLVNRIEANLHAQTSVGVSVGHHSTDRVYGNTWRLVIQPTSGIAFQSWGQNDKVEIDIHAGEGSPSNGVRLEASASKNKILIGRNDAVVPVVDASTSQDNVIW